MVLTQVLLLLERKTRIACTPFCCSCGLTFFLILKAQCSGNTLGSDSMIQGVLSCDAKGFRQCQGLNASLVHDVFTQAIDLSSALIC